MVIWAPIAHKPRPLQYLALYGSLVVLTSLLAACEVDEDADGFSLKTGDCDDLDPSVRPDAKEVCDGKDNDCNGQVDEGLEAAEAWRDQDGDGFGASRVILSSCSVPKGYSGLPGDCDDQDSSVHPGVLELCDGKDTDCDPITEETREFYPDQDGDGFGGSAGEVLVACDPPEGYAEGTSDCNDLAADIHPGAMDLEGDGLDQDCGGRDGPQPNIGLEDSDYETIQAAVDDALDGDTVWVGPGRYQEHEISLGGKAITLVSVRGAASTVLDARSAGRVMVFVSGEGSSTVVRGFTLTGGLADVGGGVKVSASSPTLEDLIMRDNRATGQGGGVALLSTSRARLKNCVIYENVNEGEYGYGGGLAISSSDVTLEGCIIQANEVVYGAGGGIYVSDSKPKLTHCLITENSADTGGGIRLDSAKATLTLCTIESNSATYGGGMSVSFSDATVRNCTFRDNRATDGGGIYFKGSSAVFSNCTVANNQAARGGGVFLGFSSSTLQNCLVTGNRADTQGGGAGVFLTGTNYVPSIISSILAYNEGFDLFNDPASPAVPVLSYNDFYTPFGPGSHNLMDLAPGNLMLEPGFVVYDEQGLPKDYHLALESPLVNAGAETGRDRDGTRTDIGIYGGSYGDDWDRDSDTWLDYFWPGSYFDAPSGFSPERFDCDDEDGEVWHCVEAEITD